MPRLIKPLTLCAAVLAPALMPLAAHGGDLLETYRLAQDQDQTLLSALYQRDATVEAYPQALAGVLPTLSGAASHSNLRQHTLKRLSATPNSDGINFYTTRAWSLNLSQPVFDWQAFQTLAQSHLQVAQAQSTYLAAEQSLMYRVADAYFTVLNAQDTLRADMDAQSAFKRQFDEAQKKFEVGLAAITDVRNAQAAYDSAQATVISDRRTLDSARRALGQIVGKTDTEVVPLQDDIPLLPPSPSNEQEWVNSATDDNPSLLSFRYAADASKKGIDVARSAWLPTLSVVGATNRQGSTLLTGSDTLTESVGLQLNWTIAQGGRIASQTRQATASWQRSIADYENQRRTVDRNTRDAYEGVITGIASVNASKQAVISNQTSLEATRVGLRVGTRTEIDVLNAQQSLAAAQRTYYRSRYDYLRSVLLLKQAAGRLSEADLAEIDALLINPAAAAP